MRAGICQHKTSRAIGRFNHARLKTRLAQHRRLLVAGHAANRQINGQYAIGAGAEIRHIIVHLRQNFARHIEQRQKLIIPIMRVNIENAGARGIGRIRRVHLPAAQLPDKPAIHRAERQIARLRPRARVGHIVEQPSNFAGRKIRVEQQACFRAHRVLVPCRGELRAKIRGAPVLPHNGIGDGVSGFSVPYHNRLALIGDADAAKIFCTRLVHHRAAHTKRGLPDLVGVVLNPTIGRKYLREFGLGDATNFTCTVKGQRATGCRSLINTQHQLVCHRIIPPVVSL